MARAFSNVKTVSAFVANEIFSVLSRRGYAAGAAASQGVASSGVKSGAPNVMLKKGSEEAAMTAWVPDPKTGFYRPEKLGKELDPAELRKMLLNNRNRAQH